MSTEAVKKFWAKAKQDKALQAKLAAIQGKDHQAAIAAVVKLAAESGFAFTAQEYEAAVREELARQHAAGELSDEQLAGMAGGIGRVGLAESVSDTIRETAWARCDPRKGA